MSDMDLNTPNANSSRNQNAGSSQNLRDQMADAGAEIKQRAGDALRASTETARDKFKEAADAAKEAAAGAADRLQDQAREQQRSGADFVGRFAGNIRDAARAFENDVPFAAAASIRRLNMLTKPRTKFATAASVTCSMVRRILQSASPRHFSVCRCWPVSPPFAS